MYFAMYLNSDSDYDSDSVSIGLIWRNEIFIYCAACYFPCNSYLSMDNFKLHRSFCYEFCTEVSVMSFEFNT